MIDNIKPYIQLSRINKPIGIYLLLWPTCWALMLSSNGKLQYSTTIVFILGVIIMRSLGCVINDLADRNIDPHVERTRTRPLANKSISVKRALIFALFLASIALLLLLILPPQTWVFAPIALLLAISYPFCKRFINCPQFILGLAFSISIPMVYAATINKVPPQAWHLFLIAVIWPLIYDTQYALTDKSDDLKIGIKSSAIWFGNYVYTIIAMLQLVFYCSWIFFARAYDLKPIFYVALAISFSMAIYQQKLIITGKRKLQFKSFENNNPVGLIILIGLAAAML